jgi:hypothetical protein
VWTGAEFIVWGGVRVADGAYGGAYDPATDSWRALSMEGPSERSNHTLVWSESRLVVWGGVDRDGDYLGDGSAYEPASDTWVALAPSPLGARDRQASVGTPHGIVIASGCCPGDGAAMLELP